MPYLERHGSTWVYDAASQLQNFNENHQTQSSKSWCGIKNLSQKLANKFI